MVRMVLLIIAALSSVFLAEDVLITQMKEAGKASENSLRSGTGKGTSTYKQISIDPSGKRKETLVEVVDALIYFKGSSFRVELTNASKASHSIAISDGKTEVICKKSKLIKPTGCEVEMFSVDHELMGPSRIGFSMHPARLNTTNPSLNLFGNDQLRVVKSNGPITTAEVVSESCNGMKIIATSDANQGSNLIDQVTFRNSKESDPYHVEKLVWDKLKDVWYVKNKTSIMTTFDIPQSTRITDQRIGAPEKFYYYNTSQQASKENLDTLIGQVTSLPRKNEINKPNYRVWYIASMVALVISSGLLHFSEDSSKK